jgi:lysosomal alpha-mannosidase
LKGDNGDFLEIEAQIGPVDISDGLGKEVFTRFTTNLDSNGTLYTDSEGEISPKIL